MIREEDVYQIGRIGKAHGIKGEVQMQFSDDVFDRTESEYVLLKVDGILVPFFMEEYRFKSDEVALVKFCDIDTQDQARDITGCEIFFPRELSDSNDDELTWSEIVGYTLIDHHSQKSVGTIADVDDSTDNILFVLSDDTLIPAPEELITGVSHKDKTITIEIPEGLLDL